MKRTLFLCTGNSAKSQMAEAGVDISKHRSKSASLLGIPRLRGTRILNMIKIVRLFLICFVIAGFSQKAHAGFWQDLKSLLTGTEKSAESNKPVVEEEKKPVAKAGAEKDKKGSPEEQKPAEEKKSEEEKEKSEKEKEKERLKKAQEELERIKKFEEINRIQKTQDDIKRMNELNRQQRDINEINRINNMQRMLDEQRRATGSVKK